MRWYRGFGILFGCIIFMGAGSVFGELITNGDFSLGGVGFNSDYQFATSNGSGGADEGKYSVNSVPNIWNTNFVAPYSAALPAGNSMLVANGSTDNWNRVWFQNISVVAGTTYDVSFAAASLFPDNPAKLRFYAGMDPSDPFNVQSVATVTLTGATGADAWVTSAGQFTAANTGTVRVFISDLTTASVGNDFAIDNISISVLSAVPEPSSLALLAIGSIVGLGIFARRRRQSKG